MENRPLLKAEKVLVAWLFASIGFLCWYFFTRTDSMIPLYYVLWLGGVGTLIWICRRKIAAGFKATPPTPRFFLLAFVMVLVEEKIAALANNLSEGFSLPLYLLRIGQFWAFNILAFTGLIAGWYWLLKRYRYSVREAFYLVSLWGLYAEHIIWRLFSEPIHFLFFALPTMFTYGLVMAPSILTSETGKANEAPKIKRYLFAFIIPFLFSLPPMILLAFLRARFPEAFPPCEFIAC